MSYTVKAMDALRAARNDNQSVSQRRFARNVFNLVRPGYAGSNISYGQADGNTPTLSSQLGYPSEIAVQHLVRGIDRKVRADAEAAAAVTNSATLNRKTTRVSRARKTVGTGTRINTNRK